MRTITKTLYTAHELKESHPEAFERAHKNYSESEWLIEHQSQELADSLKGLFDHTSWIALRSWSFGAYCRGTYARVSFSQDGAESLTGPRAMAWLENNLLSSLRVPFAPIAGQGPRSLDRRKYARCGEGYRPGQVKSCPFTGVCYDEMLLDALIKEVREGATLKDAFQGLADECSRILENELDYAQSEEAFLDDADANNREFYEDGSEA